MFHYLITALIDYIFCIFAASRKNNRASISTAFGAFCLGTWALELFFLSYITDLKMLYPLFHITRWGMFFISFSLAFLAYQLITRRSETYLRWVLIPGFVSCAALGLANVTVLPTTLVPVAGGFLPELDITFYWYVLNFSLLAIGAVFYCATSYKQSPQREKQKIKGLMVTLIFLVVFGWTALYLLSKHFYLSKFIGAIINLLFISVFYIAIGNQLANFRLTILGAAINGSVILAYVGVYFLLTNFLGDIVFSAGGVLFIFLFLLITVQTYPKATRHLVPAIKRALYKNIYDLEIIRRESQEKLYKCTNLSEMTKVLDGIFYDALHVKNYGFRLVAGEESERLKTILSENNREEFGLLQKSSYLLQQQVTSAGIIMFDEVDEAAMRELRDFNAECFFPVRQHQKTLAVVTIGAPTDRDYYQQEDLYLLEWVSQELGRVVDRIIQSHRALDELGQARKTLSLIGVMNQYHHDIKTPLAIIDGVLSADIYSQEKQRQIVMEQVERGTKLIATMATILRGKRSRSTTPTLLNNIIRDSLFVLEKRFHKVILNLEELPLITGDAVDLKIMFINVIKNAAEAGQGGKALELTISSWSAHNNAFISFSDTGAGMTAKQCETIWEDGLSTKPMGSGIGLQAIKRIADEHAATISVNSAPGQGTTFTFRFVSSVM